MNEIKELVGFAESKDPTDRDRFHLKLVVKKLKQRNESLTDECAQMSKVIDQLKGGRFNESESVKFMMSEQQTILKDDMQAIKEELDVLRRENATLKVNSSKGVEMQSAMQSNNAAI